MAVAPDRTANEPRPSPLQSVSRNASNLFGDAFELAELQAAMLRFDFVQFRGRIWKAVWAIPLAIGLCLAGLPVLAMAVAGTLSAVLGWPPYVGQWIVGGSFFVLAALLAFVAARAVRKSLGAFGSSQRELQANLKWLRQMLTRDSSVDRDYTTTVPVEQKT